MYKMVIAAIYYEIPKKSKTANGRQVATSKKGGGRELGPAEIATHRCDSRAISILAVF